ncbi:MAG: hypothetical protein LKKZDAJK_002383 [Candidatus Fervidibacter sp.]
MSAPLFHTTDRDAMLFARLQQQGDVDGSVLPTAHYHFALHDEDGFFALHHDDDFGHSPRFRDEDQPLLDSFGKGEVTTTVTFGDGQGEHGEEVGSDLRIV